MEKPAILFGRIRSGIQFVTNEFLWCTGWGPDRTKRQCWHCGVDVCCLVLLISAWKTVWSFWRIWILPEDVIGAVYQDDGYPLENVSDCRLQRKDETTAYCCQIYYIRQQSLKNDDRFSYAHGNMRLRRSEATSLVVTTRPEYLPITEYQQRSDIRWSKDRGCINQRKSNRSDSTCCLCKGLHWRLKS